MTKRARGFTMIEVLAVVAIIGILATITFMGFGRYQADTRDNSRAAKATILSEALEKYYDKNGEYPSCSAVSGTGATVTTSVLPGVALDVLLTPKSLAGDTNSITCTDLTGAAGEADIFAYVGDGSAACMSGEACLVFTLKYREEITGDIKTVNSRRTTNIATSGGTTLTATPTSFVQIDLSWIAIDNALSYTLQRATNNAFTDNMVESTTVNTSTTAVGLTDGTLYYFRVTPVSSSGSQGQWSIASAATLQNTAPTAPVITVTSSASNVLATISPVTCQAGATAQYEIRSRTNNGTWGSYSAWSATTGASQPATQGVKYGYQAQARCYASISTSPTATGTEGTYTYPINPPGTPTVAVNTVGNISTWSWGATTCPSGTTALYQYKYQADWNYDSAWYGPYASTNSLNWDTFAQGYVYVLIVQTNCYNTNTTSSWSSGGQASYLRQVNPPGPTITFNIMWYAPTTITSIQSTASPGCNGLTSTYSRADMHTWDYVWDSGVNGWYANSHGGVWLVNWAYRGNQLLVSASGNHAQGSRWNMAIEMQCRNVGTGRYSASTGRIETATLLRP